MSATPGPLRYWRHDATGDVYDVRGPDVDPAQFFARPEEWTEVTVTPVGPQCAATCAHSSATGVDQTPLNDPAKAWRCDVCGLRWSATSPADGDTEEVERAWDEGYRSALLTIPANTAEVAERIAQAIEKESAYRTGLNPEGDSERIVGIAFGTAARIAREHATTPPVAAIDLPGFEGTRSALDALTTRKAKTDD